MLQESTWRVNPPCLPGSYAAAVLVWKSEYWMIPEETDLVLETRLAPRGRDPIKPVAYYFSATAVALAFFKQLPQAMRKRLRRKLVIKEEFKGVAYPESHIRGIQPHCLENPHLRFDIRVGF
jgi:hypothetical protein